MNNFSEFLYELRKEKGMTQAELAEALGVTNKAISKWETGEAMPETSLLLPIANIFNVTVDELLNGKRAEIVKKETNNETNNNKTNNINDNLFTKGKDDEPETFLEKICGAVCAFVVLGGLLVYLLLGAFANLWDKYWLIVPVCALSCGIIAIIFGLFDKESRSRKIANGKNPYIDSICGMLMLVCIIAYLCCGAIASLWHPYWVIIVVGMVLCGCIGSIGNIKSSKKED